MNLKDRGVGWIGAILIFILGSLVLTYALNPQVQNRINDFISDVGNLTSSSILSPSDVRAHPDQYLGQEITVEGYYFQWLGVCEKTMGNDPNSEILHLANESRFDLIEGGKYQFTGVLRRRDSSVELVVSDVKAV